MLTVTVLDDAGLPRAGAIVQLQDGPTCLEAGLTDASGEYNTSLIDAVTLVVDGVVKAVLLADDDLRRVGFPVNDTIDADVVANIPPGDKQINMNLTVQSGAGATLTIALNDPGYAVQRFTLVAAENGIDGVFSSPISCDAEYAKMTLVVEKPGFARTSVTVGLTWNNGRSACLVGQLWCLATPPPPPPPPPPP